MKKILLFFGLVIVSCCYAMATDVSGSAGAIQWQFNKETGVLTLSGKGKMDDYQSASNTSWYTFRQSIKKVIIHKGITTIGRNSFEGCHNLADIIIPSTIKEIGKYAFDGCNSLSSVYITDLSTWCRVKMESSPFAYADKLFFNGHLLTELVIPDDVTELNTSFQNCKYITTITISKNIKKINYHAFDGCGSLSNVIWNAKSDVSTNRFSSYDYEYSPLGYISSQITSITFGKDVVSIQHDLCGNMENLTSVIITDGISTIGDRAFQNCKNLQSVSIPPTVKEIGEQVFSGCKQLSAIYITDLSAWCKIEYPKRHNFLGKNYQGKYVHEFDVDKEDLPLYYAQKLYLNGKLLSDLGIPDDIKEIDQEFQYCTSIKSITFPSTVRRIGDYKHHAFEGCSNLVSVNWNINNYAYDSPWTYSNAEFITSFKFGSNVTVIPTNCCANMQSLTSITIPSSVKQIKERAFHNCTDLDSVFITDIAAFCAVQQESFPLSWARHLYVNGKLVTEVQWPEKVKQVGPTFRFYRGLEKVDIPNGVTSIGPYAFQGCSNLKSIAIPVSIQEIGEQAFAGCWDLMQAFVPNTVKRIGKDAFEDVPNLEYYDNRIPNAPWGARSLNGYVKDGLVYYDESKKTIRACSPSFKGAVRIPNSVQQINTNAFFDCHGISSVHIDNLENWCKIKFMNDKANPLLYSDTLFIADTLVTDLYFQTGIKEIGQYAFINCPSLQYVVLPPSLEKIGRGAFRGIPLLICDKTPEGAPWGAKRMEEGGWIENGIIYNDPTKTVIKKCLTSVSGDVVLPPTVTKIEALAFRDCSRMTSITISPALKEVGDSAFYNCRRLSAVHISDIDAWSQIYFDHTPVSNPLYYANNLYLNNQLVREVKLSSKVKKIGQFAFANCRSLCRINIPHSIETIGWGAFIGCSNLIQISIPEGVSIIDGVTFKKCVNLKSVTIPNSITTIGRSAFYDCSALTSVTIPNSVTSIGEWAFYGCSALTSVTIPNSVISIGKSAFYDCSALTSVTIPNSVTSIGEWAFAHVNNITYSGSATGQPWSSKSINGYIDGYFVYKDSSKKELLGCSSTVKGHITIPNSVTSIGDHAFRSCTALTSITIPNSVTSIGKRAFNGCTALTSVTIPNSVTSIGEHAFNQVNNIINFCNASGARWGAKCENGFVDGNLVYKDSSKKELEGCSSYVKGHITIPNSVTSIGGFAFYGCSTLTSVTIPNSVTSIGNYAFSDCSALTSVTIPNSVTSIGDRAFSDCSALTSVTIPNSVTSIGEWAFYGCSALTSVTIMQRSPSMRMDYQKVFEDCSKLQTLYIPSTIEQPKGLDPTIDIINIQKDSSRLELIPHSLKIDDPNNNGRVEVDEPCVIRFTLCNKGKGDAIGSKVHVMMDNDLFAFLHIASETTLSEIKSEDSVKVEIPVYIDKNSPEVSIPIQISVSEVQGEGISPTTLHLQTSSFSPPKIQLQYSVSSALSVAQKTNSLIYKMVVKNVGNGIARNVSCDIKLPASLQHLSGELQKRWEVIYAGDEKDFSVKLTSNEKSPDSLSVDYILKEKYGQYATSGYIPLVFGKTPTYKTTLTEYKTLAVAGNPQIAMLVNTSVQILCPGWFEKYNNPQNVKSPFPYAAIKLELKGNKESVEVAKERLSLIMGGKHIVEIKDTKETNTIWFLVHCRNEYIDLDCGDGCEPINIWKERLEPNRVYTGDVYLSIHNI